MMPDSMIQSTITSRGQTTVPKPVRKALGLEPGDRVRYTIEDGTARLRPLRSIERLRGIVNHRGPAVTLDEMDRAIAGGAAGS